MSSLIWCSLGMLKESRWDGRNEFNWPPLLSEQLSSAIINTCTGGLFCLTWNCKQFNCSHMLHQFLLLRRYSPKCCKCTCSFCKDLAFSPFWFLSAVHKERCLTHHQLKAWNNIRDIVFSDPNGLLYLLVWIFKVFLFQDYPNFIRNVHLTNTALHKTRTSVFTVRPMTRLHPATTTAVVAAAIAAY